MTPETPQAVTPQLLEQIRINEPPGTSREFIGKLIAVAQEFSDTFEQIKPLEASMTWSAFRKELVQKLRPVAEELSETLKKIQADNELSVLNKLVGELTSIAEESMDAIIRIKIYESVGRDMLLKLPTLIQKLTDTLEQIRTAGMLVPPYILLANRLRLDTTLDILDLHDSKLSADAITIVLHSIRRHPTLRVLNLSNNRGLSEAKNARGIKAVARFLEKNHTLKVLNLSNNDFSVHRDAAEQLARSIQTSHLVELNLSHTGITSTFLSHLSPALKGNDTHLEILDLSHNEFDKEYLVRTCSGGFDRIIEALKENRVLRILLLNNCNLYDHQIDDLTRNVLKQANALVKLDVASNTNCEGKCYGALISSLKTHWSLHQLALDKYRLDDTQRRTLDTQLARNTRLSLNWGRASLYIALKRANAGSELAEPDLRLIEAIAKMAYSSSPIGGDTPLFDFIQDLNKQGKPIDSFCTIASIIKKVAEGEIPLDDFVLPLNQLIKRLAENGSPIDDSALPLVRSITELAKGDITFNDFVLSLVDTFKRILEGAVPRDNIILISLFNAIEQTEVIGFSFSRAPRIKNLQNIVDTRLYKIHLTPEVRSSMTERFESIYSEECSEPTECTDYYPREDKNYFKEEHPLFYLWGYHQLVDVKKDWSVTHKDYYSENHYSEIHPLVYSWDKVGDMNYRIRIRYGNSWGEIIHTEDIPNYWPLNSQIRAQAERETGIYGCVRIPSDETELASKGCGSLLCLGCLTCTWLCILPFYANHIETRKKELIARNWTLREKIEELTKKLHKEADEKAAKTIASMFKKAEEIINGRMAETQQLVDDKIRQIAKDQLTQVLADVTADGDVKINIENRQLKNDGPTLTTQYKISQSNDIVVSASADPLPASVPSAVEIQTVSENRQSTPSLLI